MRPYTHIYNDCASCLNLFHSESSRSSDLKHAPFLSTPLSVRKVRYSQLSLWSHSQTIPPCMGWGQTGIGGKSLLSFYLSLPMPTIPICCETSFFLNGLELRILLAYNQIDLPLYFLFPLGRDLVWFILRLSTMPPALPSPRSRITLLSLVL